MHNPRKNRSKIPHNEVIKRYLNGESSVKIAKIAGISATGIIRILRFNNISRRPKELAERLRRKYNYEAIVKDYNSGMFLGDVAKKYHCDPPGIDSILKRMSVKKMHGVRKGKDHAQWKGGIRKDVHGYLVQKEGKTHRIILERYLGRKLKIDEQIHHIDGNKKNNELDNLSIFSKEHHNRFETFLRFANLKQNKQNLIKFCHQKNEFLWEFTAEDYQKIKKENKYKITNPNSIKAKKCKHCGRKQAGYGLCSQLYQRMKAKQRGYWKSSKGRISKFLKRP